MPTRFVSLVVIGSLLAGAAWAAPIDPAIDVAGPFSYFSRPSTVLGVADSQDGTQVGPEGWLWTGSAQLIFFAGPELAPLRERIHTLSDGRLPIVSHATRIGDIQYRVTMFGATLDGKAESNLINFVRVTLRNVGPRPAAASFAAAIRAEGPYCCERLRVPWVLLTARYALTPGYATRNDQLIYTFPTTPEPRRLVTPDRGGAGSVSGKEEGIIREAPVCMVRYDLQLAPDESRNLDFTMPYNPVPLADAGTVTALQKASFDEYLRRTESWWRAFLAKGMQIELPERKVIDTYYAGLTYDAIARVKSAEDYIVTVNRFQYHYFWVRDGAYIINAFDMAGKHLWAERGLDYYLKQQQSDGILYQPPQLDGYGQTLWAFGSHWRLTGDLAWARRVYPYLARHVRGVFASVGRDPLGLVPAAPPYDNEAINGHYTGHSFWLLIGMRDVIAMARALGETQDAEQFTRWYEEYRARFLRVLDATTARTGGYIPPGLDAEEGCDWDNSLSLYPRGGAPAKGALELTDPRVQETINRIRKYKYAEGIMTYGRGMRLGELHHYDTIKLTEDLVALNRQRDALSDLYSILVHTSSAQAGFEGGGPPWDSRDPGGNFPPHGWFAAEYIGLLRNMLVREWDGDLHLLSVVSPEWLKPGGTIAVRRAPTDFGLISLVAQVAENGITLRLNPRWREAPRSMILHLPWFLEATCARADGVMVPLQRAPLGQGQQVVLKPTVRQVEVRWRPTRLPKLSYAAAVADWRREYKARFAAFVKGGGRPEPLWHEASLPMTREARMESWSGLEEQAGIAVGCQATASASEPGNVPANAVAGSVNRSIYWGATPYPAWWQVDLGAERKIDRVRVVTYWDEGAEGRIYQYKVLASADATNWTLVGDASKNEQRATPEGQLHSFRPVTARYVRVEMLHNSLNAGVHLVAVMVYPAVVAPLAEPPATSQPAWTAEDQAGAKATDMSSWGFVGAQRILLSPKAVKAGGDRVRLEFRGGHANGIAIADVSLGLTDPADSQDIVRGSRVPITFAEANSVELPAGGAVKSDWIKFPLQAGKGLTVTFRVLRTGATTLWPDTRTIRYESGAGAAATATRWSAAAHSTTYNLYFVSQVETGK